VEETQEQVLARRSVRSVAPGPGKAISSVLHRSVEGGVVTLTIESGAHNALTGALSDLFVAALDDYAADPDVRVVVVTGAGRRFCTGADVSSSDAFIKIFETDGATEPGYHEPGGRMALAIGRLGKPVIAAVNGDAIGGGATSILAADLRFAADTARFSFPFTRFGVCPEGASTYYLPRLVGPSRASDWLLSGRTIDADEALGAGMVNRVLPAAEVLPAAQDYAQELAATTSPAAVMMTRAMLAAAPGSAVAASDVESREIVRMAHQPDCAEGISAFLERRPARFAAAVRQP
jgi:enoyl-CoA hydratase/carnithine racemase